MYEILTNGCLCTGFAGHGWRILIADGDPLDHVPDADGEQLVVLDPLVTADAIRRQVEADHNVVVVLPERAFERAVQLASDLAA